MRYALVLNGVITAEREYADAPECKVIDGKPVLRPIRIEDAEYNPDTQRYIVERTIHNYEVVDKWVIIPLTADEVKLKLCTALAAYRYERQIAGIVVGGVRVSTEPEVLNLLTGARIKAKESADYKLDWTNVTETVQLTAAQIIGLADAAAAYVQKCFTAQASVIEMIGTFSSIAAALSAFDAKMSEGA